jgi:glycogen operon protein
MRIAPHLTAAVALSGAACTADDYTRLYHTQALAPSLTWEAVETMDHMGPVVIDRGVNFVVYSERAERLELLLFDDPEADLPAWQIPLEQGPNNSPFWSVYVEGVGVGQHFGYVAWGPNWTYDADWFPGSTIGFKTDVDGDGNRFNPNKLLFDPWGKAIHRDHDWFAGSTASGPKRHESTWRAGSKSVVVASDYTWSTAEQGWVDARASGDLEGHAWNELVFYEVHPKGFTRNPASGVEHPGTWRGIGEMAPYLQDLGITAVELLPIHEKPLDGGYWGYNNLNFFAPEHTYSAEWQATGDVRDVLDEFKWMVDQLHQHDIEVIVDVVYNHTGEGGLWRERLYFETYEDAEEVNFDPKEVAGLYSFRGLDNHAWYALSPDGQTYWNNTGVGNQTRPNHVPMQRMITDSLHFMVEELHVDGFRFDLAGILGEADLDYNSYVDPAETVLQDIIDDPVMIDNNVRIISEPWTAAGTGPGIGGFPASSVDPDFAWAEWNAHFRDWWRSFVNDDAFVLNSTEGVDGGAVMTGSEPVYGWNDRKPYHAVNFVTVHDGFTLYDLFSYEEKQNGCGLLNPVCCNDPLSVWCDDESGESHNRSRNWGDEATKRQMMRNLFAALFISHGSPMILGGDEWMRTQFGNNNAYSDGSDNEWNWFRWGEWQSSYAWQRYRMHDFVRGLTRLRRERTYALSPTEYGGGMPLYWKNAGNGDMEGSQWGSQRHVAMHYVAEGEHADKPDLLVLINMERGDVTFTLPGGRDWGRLVDTQSWFDMPATADQRGQGGWFDDNPTLDPYYSANISLDDPVPVEGGSYTVLANTIVILEQQD